MSDTHGKPRNADGSINYNYVDGGMECWRKKNMYHCARGFVSDPRFGPNELVIKRTNRQVTKKWRALASKEA